ncbi:MAG: hypothetical protein BAA01_16265 [Bacillus thermozeamaize]|uniref:Glycerol operon regulatory protein n=1 Tax=Bacillus thermozeamaize TaxID=230954 RepID=A0A1Y3PTP8_9BACI|nr:MAG: hypothetical protein BAA01_16265 [Bacillus thermozeamaize]
MADSIKSVVKLINILNCFSLEKREWSIKELHEQTGYNKSTIYRLLATLQEHGYMEQNPVNQKYYLGFRFFHLGSIVLNSMDLRQAALPIMKRLAEETKETIELNIIDQNQRVCIDKVDSPETVRNFVRVGERNPLHLGASGKILLAHLERAIQRQILEKYGIDPEQQEHILSELDKIQSEGFVVTRGERVPGSFAIAVPIRDHTNKVIAGLTMAGPIQRLTDEHLNDSILKVKRAGLEISERLGYLKQRG